MDIAEQLEQRLSDGEVVVIDGGTGTALQARGVPMDAGTWCGAANLEHGEDVQAVHEAYIVAGAQVIIANTFATNRRGLEMSGLDDRVEEVNRKAVEAALRARAAVAEQPVAIAGSLSPFCAMTTRDQVVAGRHVGEGMPGPEEQYRPTFSDFREQATILAEAGVDLLALEMINSPSYGHAAIEAATSTGLPVWLGLSPWRLEDGSLGTVQEAPGDHPSFEELVAELVVPGLAAVNVMHGKANLVEDALEVVRRHYDGPIGVYAEAGDWTPPNWVFTDLEPDEYLAAARDWVARGAQIVGGCCGIGPTHIQALATGLPRRIGES